MSTTLEITFRCMCLFAQDEETGQTHVLMPSTDACLDGHGEGHAAIEKHVVQLVFPFKGGPLSADGDTFVADPATEGEADHRDMEGWSLTLPGVEGGTPPARDENPDIILAPLGPVTRGKVDRTLFNGGRDRRLASRVTLNAGGISGKHSVARWDFNGEKKVKLAQEVTWRIENLPDGPLQLTRLRLGAPDERDDLPPLQPVDGVIRLRVLHVSETDFPTPQERDPNVTRVHFAAFYCLFDQVRTRELPAFVDRYQTGTAGCLGARIP